MQSFTTIVIALVIIRAVVIAVTVVITTTLTVFFVNCNNYPYYFITKVIYPATINSITSFLYKANDIKKMVSSLVKVIIQALIIFILTNPKRSV